MNKEKEKKGLSTFTIISLILAMVCTVTVSNTYAKYATSLSGSDSAKVALWKWEINDEAITSATTTTYTLDLFKTINDSTGAKETDVKEGKIVAPGTQGSFTINIKNSSEVNAKYAVEFTTANAGNIQFSTDGTTYTNNLANIPATDIAMGATKTVTVYWKWAYEVDDDTDSADTVLGFAGNAEPTVTAKLSVVQVD